MRPMNARFASLIAAGALIALASPALAQDIDGAAPPERGEWRDGPPPMPMPPGGMQRFERRVVGPMAGPRPGYSPDERGAWIEECRANFRGPDRFEDGRGRRRGAAIGAGVGAVGGGIAGNRIAGRGDRLAGTAIGAGVGAVAGAVVGSAIGAAADRGRGGPDEYCEQYLSRYEGGMAGPGMPMPMGPMAHGMPMGPGMAPPMGYEWQPGYVTPGYMVPPLVWVRVPIFHERRDCGCEEVIEEEVITRPAPRARRVIHRQTKYSKYSR
jgi:hypothetical protein